MENEDLDDFFAKKDKTSKKKSKGKVTVSDILAKQDEKPKKGTKKKAKSKTAQGDSKNDDVGVHFCHMFNVFQD